MILKLNSKGEDVKNLQKFLGLIADGNFGPKTEAAVKQWQKDHGLTADGIVGDHTWKAMFGTNTKAIDPCVIYKPLSVHISKLPNREIKYLAIHFTAGSKSVAGVAQNMYNTFVARPASADFGVDDRDIVQFNPDIKNYYCWAVGDKKNPYSSGGILNGKANNKNTISIEICSTCFPATASAISMPNHSGWKFSEAALNNATKLAKIIMKKYNIPIENVVRHYDITGKLCPGIIGWNNEPIYDLNSKKNISVKSDSNAWIKFKQRLV